MGTLVYMQQLIGTVTEGVQWVYPLPLPPPLPLLLDYTLPAVVSISDGCSLDSDGCSDYPCPPPSAWPPADADVVTDVWQWYTKLTWVWGMLLPRLRKAASGTPSCRHSSTHSHSLPPRGHPSPHTDTTMYPLPPTQEHTSNHILCHEGWLWGEYV